MIADTGCTAAPPSLAARLQVFIRCRTRGWVNRFVLSASTFRFSLATFSSVARELAFLERRASGQLAATSPNLRVQPLRSIHSPFAEGCLLGAQPGHGCHPAVGP